MKDVTKKMLLFFSHTAKAKRSLRIVPASHTLWEISRPETAAVAFNVHCRVKELNGLSPPFPPFKFVYWAREGFMHGVRDIAYVVVFVEMNIE